jgi:hypothetical protein
MTEKPLTPLEIYKVLEKSNCGRCQLPSCLAFSAAVVAGDKKLKDCPQLDEQICEQLTGSLTTRAEMDSEQAEFLNQLEVKVSGLDLARIAPVIGATYKDGRIVINSLGKDFQIDQQGQLFSECHIIHWVKAPLLSYITNPEHQAITGTWSTFRELPDSTGRHNLFTRRCEQVLKELADEHPGLLTDIVDLFMGVTTEGFEADIALILHPLPHFPLLICYQAPDDDLESELTIFFDACCGVNLNINSIYTLCVGLVQMFGKIAQKHS